MSAQTPPEIPNTPSELNPYAPPTTMEPAAPISSTEEAEALRRPLLAHEASIKGIGALFILGGLVFLGLVITTLLNPGYFSNGANNSENVIFMAVMGVVGLGELLTGWYLRRFKKWARGVGIVLCAISLINIPLGTVLGAYFLYVLLGSKGTTVFSDRYQEAMRATPHLKYRTPLWMWILLAVLVLLFIGLAFAASSGALD